MSIKILNEGFELLHKNSLCEEKSNSSDLEKALESALDNLAMRQEMNIKKYEIAFQDAIEGQYPDKSWWEVTDCDIFSDLAENRDPSLTIKHILAGLKPELKEAVGEDSEKEYKVRKPIKESLRRKRLGESEKEPTIKRYSDVRPRSERKYWYFTTHGVQPGSIPRDLNVLEVRDGENERGTQGTFVMLDGVLNTSELRKYDMRELAPKEETERRRMRPQGERIAAWESLKNKKKKSSLKEDYITDLVAEILSGKVKKPSHKVFKWKSNNGDSGEVTYRGVDYAFRKLPNGDYKVMRSSDAGWNWSETLFKESKLREGKNLKEAEAPADYSPKKQGKAYKVFRVKNGKLYPPMVSNPGGADTPIGKWLIADEGEFAGLSKTGRPQVKSSQGGTLSYRPGWHLGDIPRASQFDRTNKETGEKEFPKDFVWAECSYTMDVDYQPESDEQGYMRVGKDGKPYRSDKYQHSLAGLPKLPKDGYYKYRTNPRPDTVPWVITGAIKVDRLLSDAEVNEILKKNGVEPIHRQGGDKTLAELGLRESFNRKLKKSLKENKKLTESFDDMEVFMNTWANYNENGADSGITPTGWMSIDDAIEYCEEYADYEPFINDTDNIPFDDIDEYSNASSVLQELKELQESDVDEDVVAAIVEAGGYDIKEAIEIAESGDYYWYPGLSSYTDLAYAVIDEIGSLKDALGDRVVNYIDEDQMRREYRWDIREIMRDTAEQEVDDEHEGEDEDSYDREQEIEDWMDEHEDEYLDMIIDEDIRMAEAGEIDLSNYFDYEAFGRDLSFDGYTIVDGGIILVN